jgi:hypothetical protein
MAEAKGCQTWRRQGQGTTITIGTATTGTTMAIGMIIITTGSHCCVTMTPRHAGCLPPRKNVPDMGGPIRCSSLMFKHEEHQKSKLRKDGTHLVYL